MKAPSVGSQRLIWSVETQMVQENGTSWWWPSAKHSRNYWRTFQAIFVPSLIWFNILVMEGLTKAIWRVLHWTFLKCCKPGKILVLNYSLCWSLRSERKLGLETSCCSSKHQKLKGKFFFSSFFQLNSFNDDENTTTSGKVTPIGAAHHGWNALIGPKKRDRLLVAERTLVNIKIEGSNPGVDLDQD